LVSIDGKPLISERKCGKGRVIYLHFVPEKVGTQIKLTDEPDLQEALMDALLRYAGYKPSALMPTNFRALTFNRGKGKAFITFKCDARIDMQHGDEVFNVYQAQDPDVNGFARLLAGRSNTLYRITDMITGEAVEVKSDSDGYVEVDISGWNMRGVYLD
ncbi:MAG: hypothetical protein ACYC27_23170, partial [Armatimonadota bacterium]